MSLNNKLYDMIFKRKSFHLFMNIGKETILQSEIDEIYDIYKSLTPLCHDIKTDIRIVPVKNISKCRGNEYCILLYSENKENYLTNMGYLGEQLDLYLVSQNIATLWYGIGKPDEPEYNGLEYVIMFMIAKVDDEKRFRKDIFKAKRKPIGEIWKGKEIRGVTDIARFAPSACNSQPWIVENEDNKFIVYRYKKPSRIGIMSPEHAKYFNRIDMGIYLCFLELCLDHNGIEYTKELFTDEGTDAEITKIANYEMI